MARRELSQLRVVVTGASSGIGRELALQFAGRGARLLITARREERLQKLVEEIARGNPSASDNAPVFVVGDVTDPQLRSKLIDAAKTHWGAIDVFINNAGAGAFGPFAEAKSKRLRQIMEVNFFAPLELIRLAIPLLQRGRQPLIVNIGSVLGHFAVPDKSEYCASKFALHGFSSALRMELAADNIDVLLVSPSTTSSEFFRKTLSERQQPSNASAMPPSLVAEKTLWAIKHGKKEIILSPGGKALVWLHRLCPSLSRFLLAKYSPRCDNRGGPTI